MALLVLATFLFLLFAVGFICAPLVRSEDELQSLYRSRPGVRKLYGPTADDNATGSTETDNAEGEYGPLLECGRTRCWHCGTVNDATYDYCGECLEPLA